MATLASTLITRTRRFMGDWPDNDALTASVSANTTSLSVADGTIYGLGWGLQLDQEALTVNSIATNSVGVLRARKGSVAATHASGATVLLRPHFLDLEYLDAINSGIAATWPYLYHAVNDVTLTTSPTVYEYAIPNGADSFPIRAIYRIQFKETGDLAFRDLRDWDVIRAAAPIIRFRRYLPAGVLRVLGFSPIVSLTSASDSLDTLFPVNCEDALCLYASQYLLASGEARRVREQTGARDDREAANRPGSSMAASQGLLQRFMMRIQASALPPLPKNVKAVF